MDITRKRLTALFGASALIAALMFMALAGFGGGTQTALASQVINVKPATLVNPKCEAGNEWHFLINGLDAASNAPTSITVTWSNGSTTVLNLLNVTGSTAHYRISATAPAVNGLTPKDATASIYDDWDGNFNLSHGPCVVLNVSKTADTTFERKFAWTIEKSVDDDSLTIPAGEDSIDANYTVTVGVDGGTDSNWKVSGAITITNPGPLAASITDVTDDLAATDCAVPFDLAVGATKTCNYTKSLSAPTDGTNHVTVTVSQNGATFKAEKAYAFGNPTTVTDECVDVTDTYSGAGLDPAQLCAPIDPNPHVYSYERTFTRDSLTDCDKDYPFDNTAKFTTTDTGTAGSDKQTVNVKAECEVSLDVTKTAKTSFDRTFTWTIDKIVDNAALTIPAGQNTVTANYTVNVGVDGGTNGNWKVSGKITIKNDGPIDATITGVTDDLATPDCGVDVSSYLLPKGDTLECTYSATLTEAKDGTNHASVTVSQSGIDPFNAEKAYSFAAEPTNLIDECVDVSDNNTGIVLDPAQLCAPIDPNPHVYTYPVTFNRANVGACDVAHPHDNTAVIKAADSGTTVKDKVTVTVTAECEMTIAVTKTADTSYNRAFTWTIAKNVDATTFTIPANGTSATANYTVSVTKSAAVDSDFTVYGDITITNTGVIPATITAVNDDLAATDCQVLPFDVPVGQSVVCHYSTTVGAATAGTNNVSVSVLKPPAGVGPTTASDGYEFGNPTNVKDDCINVSDSYAGFLGNTCASQSYFYGRTFTRGIDIVNCGETYYFDNTAWFDAPSTAYGESSQQVNVTATCQILWCSPGYWAQHQDVAATYVDLSTPYSAIGGAALSKKAPKGYDPTLAEVLNAPNTYGGPAFNSVANYISGIAFYPYGGTQDTGHNCPL